jgi:hypothetical protein
VLVQRQFPRACTIGLNSEGRLGGHLLCAAGHLDQ